MRLYLDIETIGCEDAEVVAEIAATITAPKTMSKPETIAKWEAEEKPAAVKEAVSKTAFDGGLGRVVCVGYALDDDEPRAFTGMERGILDSVLTITAGDFAATVIGHNVAWDVRFLWQRFVINGIRSPRWLRDAVKAKPWEIADTMLLWNSERDRKTSLDKLCRFLGVASSKSDMDGSKVWDAYRAGELAKIADYCIGDVRAMRECHRIMTL